MNKKVLSAILFSALFAGTGTFTSCIDTDEPAGIEELRGAKAELIRAKVAVEQANAAYTLAAAEVEKAKAAKEAALAKQEEATARLLQAQAEAEEAVTAEAKAQAEANIAVIKAALEETLLEYQNSVLEEKTLLLEAQRNYEIAVKQAEIAKALMSEKAFVKYSKLAKEVQTKQGNLDSKQAEIDAKLAELKSAVLVFDLDSAFEVRKAENALNVHKANLEGQKELIAKYEKYLANDSTLETSEWRAEIAKIEDEIAEQTKKIAVFAVDSAKAMNGEERKALDKAIADAKKALDAENDSLNLKLAEDLKDTLLYFGTTKDEMTKINFVADGTRTIADVVALLAPNYATADSLTYTGILKELRDEHDSYTAERQYWLDSIKNKLAEGPAATKKAGEEAKKAYTDAKAAYAAGKDLSTDALSKATTGAIAKFDAAITAAAGDPVKISKAQAAFADAIVAYYNSLPASQVAVNSVTLQVAGKSTYNTKTIVAWLSDADYKDVYVERLIAYFGGDKTKLYALNTVTKEVLHETTGAPTTKLNGAFGKYMPKSVTGDQYTATTAAGKTTYTAKSLLGSLEIASLLAFGEAADYVKASDFGTTGIEQKTYLQDVPSDNDIKYVALVLSKGVGAWGDYVLSQDDEVDYLTNNHKAIKADLKSAIDNLTAYVNEFKAYLVKANADVTAATKVYTDAQTALTKFADEVKQEYLANTYELEANLSYMRRLADDLWYAVKLYLEPDYKDYNGEAGFIKALEEKLKSLKDDLINYEYEVAKAEYNLQLVKDGSFGAAENVAKIKAELETLEAEKAVIVAALNAALEALAEAEEIWFAAE